VVFITTKGKTAKNLYPTMTNSTSHLKYKIFCVLIEASAIALASFYLSKNKTISEVSNSTVLSEKALGTHKIKYFEPDSFWQGVTLEKLSEVNKSKIVAAVVPHHLYAGTLISEIFEKLKSDLPKTVIIASPNHYWRGESDVLTTRFAWETPFGNVEPDIDFTLKLLEENLAQADEETLEKEHGVGGIMPYIKYYLPNAHVVPLVLKRPINYEKLEALSEWLKINAPKDSLLISSVDFSHYLNAEAAQKKDNETLKLIEDNKFTKILNLGESHIDSPGALVLAMRYSQSLGVNKFTVVKNTNSGLLAKNPYIQTTSYFTIIFETD
jgi:MEMO1 family protein